MTLFNKKQQQLPNVSDIFYIGSPSCDSDKVTPRRGSNHAAGYDLVTQEGFILTDGATHVVKTGVHLDMRDRSVFGLVVPRSSLGKRGMVLTNTVGIIDPDYQGEILIEIKNTSGGPLRIELYERIAQIIFIPFVIAEGDDAITRVDNFAGRTERGTGGFGSTGKK